MAALHSSLDMTDCLRWTTIVKQKSFSLFFLLQLSIYETDYGWGFQDLSADKQ